MHKNLGVFIKNTVNLPFPNGSYYLKFVLEKHEESSIIYRRVTDFRQWYQCPTNELYKERLRSRMERHPKFGRKSPA